MEFLSFFLLYLIIMFYVGENSDLPAHTRIAMQKYESGNLFEGNFLFYLLVNAITFFSCIEIGLKIAICLLLALGTTWKCIVTNNILAADGIKKSFWWALSLAFVFVLPLWLWKRPEWYLIYYVPNVWHNSTIIFLFPFAILLFSFSQKQMQSYDAKRNWMIVLLVALNIWIKPSYFFVFACVYPIMLFTNYRLSVTFWKSAIPIILGGILLLLEYGMIYHGSAYIEGTERSSVVVSFSNVLNPHWLLTRSKYLFISLLFPIAYIATHVKSVVKDKTFIYILLHLLVAVLIFWLCYETGPRAMHGNFYWQIVICVWLLYFYIVRLLLNNYNTITNKLLIVFYLIHVFVGILYLMKFIILKNFG